jgi:hypothetical protein
VSLRFCSGCRKGEKTRDGLAQVTCLVNYGQANHGHPGATVLCHGIGDNLKNAKVAAAKDAIRQARRAGIVA